MLAQVLLIFFVEIKKTELYFAFIFLAIALGSCFNFYCFEIFNFSFAGIAVLTLGHQNSAFPGFLFVFRFEGV